jgi:hypothetical protein
MAWRGRTACPMLRPVVERGRGSGRPGRRLAWLALAGFALLPGCAKVGGPLAASSDHVVPIRLPDPAYETLFPYYAQLCAVSRFERLGVERGGSAGHAVLYLKGVCRDEDAPFPTLRMCPERVDDLRDPRHGVGVSVNAAYRNVNWVAYSGRDLFFNGNLRRGEPLTQAHFDATLRAVAASGVLRGVQVDESRLVYTHPERPLEERIAESLLGTDVAIRFARSVWCASVPLEREQMERAVAYLNGLNRRYASGEATYDYTLYYDNCARALHDSLAAAGVWEPRKQRSRFLGQVLQMGVPANEFVALASRITLFPIEDFGAVRRDAAMAESLRDLDWLPTRQGALVGSAPVHRPNQLYDTSLQMFVLEGPKESATRRAQRILDDARFTQLEPNLLYYEDLYTKILAQQPGRELWPPSEATRELRERYHAYVAAQLEDVRGLLRRFYAEPPP